MSRLRVTVRGDGTELRGYATIEALVSLTSEPGQQPYVVMASPAEDDWSPFREEELRELHHFETEQALEKVRAAIANHPACEAHPDDDVVKCGWKQAVLDIQAALA